MVFQVNLCQAGVDTYKSWGPPQKVVQNFYFQDQRCWHLEEVVSTPANKTKEKENEKVGVDPRNYVSTPLIKILRFEDTFWPKSSGKKQPNQSLNQIYTQPPQ